MMWLTFLFAFLLQLQALQVCTACSAADGYMTRELDGVTTCCKTTNCRPGEGFSFCNGSIAAPGEDKCYNCSVGTYNKDPINTAQMPDQLNVCAPIDCSCHHDGTIIWNFDSCRKGSDPVCVCNREKLFFGLDPNTCQRIDDVNTKSRIKKPGFELDNNGKVVRCQGGYFKSTADLSICKPHTQCPAEVGLKVKVEGTATTDAMCENRTDVLSSGESTSPPPIDKDKNVTHPIEPESPVGEPVYVYVIALSTAVIILCIICWLVRRYSLAEKFCRLIGKVTQRQEMIEDFSNLEDDDPNIPLRGYPNPEREPAVFSEVEESEANQRSQSITDFVDPSSLPSTINMQSDHDSRTLGSEDFFEQNEQTSPKAIQSSSLENSSSNIGHERPVASGSEDFFEQNEQTSPKAIQNSSLENSSSNIGHERPVASVLPSVRQSSQEEQETGQVIASPEQEDEVRLALGVNTYTLPSNNRAQPDSGMKKAPHDQM